MAKRITRIVLTGGPAAGKTTLTSRILKEFKQDDGWRVITIPETATELMAGFGIRRSAAAFRCWSSNISSSPTSSTKSSSRCARRRWCPEENVLILYDRAVFDDKAYVSDDEFRAVLASFGKTEEEILAGYDAVLHLVSCAKGAEFAYNSATPCATNPLKARGRWTTKPSGPGARTPICTSSTTPSTSRTR